MSSTASHVALKSRVHAVTEERSDEDVERQRVHLRLDVEGAALADEAAIERVDRLIDLAEHERYERREALPPEARLHHGAPLDPGLTAEGEEAVARDLGEQVVRLALECRTRDPLFFHERGAHVVRMANHHAAVAARELEGEDVAVPGPRLPRPQGTELQRDAQQG